MAKFILTKYLVDACWYGRRSAGTQPSVTDFSDVISRYYSWVNSLPSIADTLVQGENVYVREVASDSSTAFLFTLWMTTSSDGSSYALKLAARPGSQSEIEQHSYPEGFSPGCPMYLYIDTESLSVYTVKPEKSLIGGKSFFEKAVRSFMLFHPDHEQLLLRDENGVAVAGDEGTQNVKPPTFRLSQCANRNEVDNIVRLAPSIRKLVHTVPVTDQTRSVLGAFLSNIWQSLEVDVDQSIEGNIHELRYEVNVDLSADQLREMINHQNGSTALGRLGFKVSASEGGRILWTDKVADQQSCELNVSSRRGVFSATGLLNGVKRHLQSQGG